MVPRAIMNQHLVPYHTSHHEGHDYGAPRAPAVNLCYISTWDSFCEHLEKIIRIKKRIKKKIVISPSGLTTSSILGGMAPVRIARPPTITLLCGMIASYWCDSPSLFGRMAGLDTLLRSSRSVDSVSLATYRPLCRPIYQRTKIIIRAAIKKTTLLVRIITTGGPTNADDVYHAWTARFWKVPHSSYAGWPSFFHR